MSIKIESHVAKQKFPSLSIFMGLPKIGKSTAMAKLPKALICDMEGKGYEGIDTEALVITPTLADLGEAIAYFFSTENKNYKILVIDHIRILTGLLAANVAASHNEKFVEAIGWQVGVRELTYTIDSYLKRINQLLAAQPDKYVMLVGHAVDKNNEIRLDIDGKNETMVLSLVDAVGFIDREDGITTVNFQSHRGVEFGTRNSNLSKYNGALDWKKLFNIASGKETVE